MEARKHLEVGLQVPVPDSATSMPGVYTIRASAVSQSDDWCGRCICSQLGNSLTMLRAVDIEVVIVSEMGTCVPWHVEDNCRSSQFLPSVQIDHALCGN